MLSSLFSSLLFTCALGALVLGGRGTLALLLLDDGFGSHRRNREKEEEEREM